MDDISICKRIAEIEKDKGALALIKLCLGVEGADALSVVIKNPLTDDALCFRLMIKYEIEAYPLVTGVGSKHMAIARVFNGCDDFIEFKQYADTLNKAICLAIIEAQKDE